MKNKLNTLFFIFGLAAFTYLVWKFGVDQIMVNIQKAGWSLLYVIMVWLFIYVLNTLAWKIILVKEISGVSIPKLFAIKVAGFTINTLTPFVAVGGEPYQVKVLGDFIGTQRSLSAVVVYRMIHLLGHMSLLICGCLCALVVVPLSGSLRVLLCAAGIVIGAIIYLTLSGHRNGIFVRLERWMTKISWTRLLWRKLAADPGALQEMDEIITRAYTNHHARFYLAVICEFVSRLLMGLELYIILHGVGIPITIPFAIFLYALYSMVINLLFFIPLNLGVREGGLILGLGSLAIPSFIGVYLGVVIRLREVFWILFGLLFILVSMNWRAATSREIDEVQSTNF